MLPNLGAGLADVVDDWEGAKDRKDEARELQWRTALFELVALAVISSVRHTLTHRHADREEQLSEHLAHDGDDDKDDKELPP